MLSPSRRLRVLSIVVEVPTHPFFRTGIRTLALLMLAVLLFCAYATIADSPPIDATLMEAYPDGIQSALETRDRFRAALPPEIEGFGLQQVFTDTVKWTPGSTVTVAFLGGDSSLHKRIADATAEWTDHCNLHFDFGYNQATHAYRTWSTSDASYKSDIRISFDMPGLWSLVGTDSRDPQISDGGTGGNPNQRSMNFSLFTVHLPQDWKAIILHEFGHALGFQHEHQHPTQGCDADFRWYDDPGYVPTKDPERQYVQDPAGRRPGIYTVLGGPPNNWPQAKVDHNLRQLHDSHMLTITDFDKSSIMKYYFPAWMFVQGGTSHCFNNGENTSLSPRDISAAEQAYPAGANATIRIERRKKFLGALVKIRGLSAIEKSRFDRQLHGIQ